MGDSEAGHQSRVISKGSRYDLVLSGHGGGINFEGLVMRFGMTANGGDRADGRQHGAVRRKTDPGRRAPGGRRLDRGTHVTASGGNIPPTDGPFTESKEVIVSFALIQARRKDEAVELARRFWKIAGDGEDDIRQVSGPEG